MRVGSALGYTLLDALFWVLSAVQWFVFIWVVLSWLLLIAANTSFRWRHRTAFNVLFQLNDFFSRATSPLLAPFRRLLPPHKTAGIDWSPMLLLLAIYILRSFLVRAFAPTLI